MNSLWWQFILRLLIYRRIEVALCVISFALGTASLLVCFPLLRSSTEEQRYLEHTLFARTLIVQPGEDDVPALINSASGVVAVGDHHKRAVVFNAQSLAEVKLGLSSSAKVFFADSRDVNLQDDRGVSVFEVTPEYFDAVNPIFISGQPFNGENGSAEIALTKGFAEREFGTIHIVGRTITLYFSPAEMHTFTPITLRISGVFEPPLETGVNFAFFSSSDIGLVSFGSLAKSSTHLIAVANSSNTTELRNSLRNLVDSDAGWTISSVQPRIAYLRGIVNARAWISVLFACGGLVVSGITVGNLMYGWAKGRRKLIGSLKVLGMTRNHIISEQLLIVTIISFLGQSIGTIIGVFLIKAISSWAKTPLHITFTDNILTMLTVLFIALLSSIGSTISSTTARPSEVFRE